MSATELTWDDLRNISFRTVDWRLRDKMTRVFRNGATSYAEVAARCGVTEAVAFLTLQSFTYYPGVPALGTWPSPPPCSVTTPPRTAAILAERPGEDVLTWRLRVDRELAELDRQRDAERAACTAETVARA